MIKVNKFGAMCLAVGLLFTAVGCGGSDSGSDAGSDSSQDTEATDQSTSSTGPDETLASDDEDDESAQECSDGSSDNLSGDDVVLFSGDVDTGQSEADITEETTASISGEGTSMEPSVLVVPVDTMFGIQITDGSLDAIVVGCAGGQTAPVGVVVGFMITETGEYPVSLEIAGTEVGTIKVVLVG